jgi:uncharacterized protein (TIGR00255 family)
MLKSMTGYGKATAETAAASITAEIKSLNSKAADIFIRIPQPLRDKELEIRSIVAEGMVRGKIELSLSIDGKTEMMAKAINAPLAAAYFKQLAELSESLGMAAGPELLATVLKMPDVFNTEAPQPDEMLWDAASAAIKDAIIMAADFRSTEGKAMQADLQARIDSIGKLMAEIEPHETSRIEKLKERIRKALDEQVGADNIDSNRFEQEMIFYLEKLDITEEKVRLAQHCKYFCQTMEDNGDQAGRKLAFIAQEIGREINTIGSKANDAGMQRIVIQMKDELEKIKEQSLNIL